MCAGFEPSAETGLTQCSISRGERGTACASETAQVRREELDVYVATCHRITGVCAGFFGVLRCLVMRTW